MSALFLQTLNPGFPDTLNAVFRRWLGMWPEPRTADYTEGKSSWGKSKNRQHNYKGTFYVENIAWLEKLKEKSLN